MLPITFVTKIALREYLKKHQNELCGLDKNHIEKFIQNFNATEYLDEDEDIAAYKIITKSEIANRLEQEGYDEYNVELVLEYGAKPIDDLYEVNENDCKLISEAIHNSNKYFVHYEEHNDHYNDVDYHDMMSDKWRKEYDDEI